MQANLRNTRIVADVKCYFCGHISGQIDSARGMPLTIGDFVPRPGFTGSLPASRARLRCDRCNGPVFFEDATPISIAPASSRPKAVVRNMPESKAA